jgi:hypothetical protein
MPRKKIAVVVTHGMGEQIPMETLRNFVEAAWVTNKAEHWPKTPSDENSGDIWFTPDPAAGSLELRRITTRWTKSKVTPTEQGPRVDFFEFYWADLAEGTTVEEVTDWVQTLLLRWPWHVPKGLMATWLFLWLASALLVVASAGVFYPWENPWWRAASAVAALAVGALMRKLIAPYLGDVARYVRADPRNIAIRYAIRKRGLKLLNDLHKTQSYERIIMVAHSLGTVIAYDLVSLMWATRSKALTVQEDEPLFQKLRAVETAAHSLAGATDADRAKFQQVYREAQRTLRLALRSGGEDGTGRPRAPEEEWLISDFVTLGSPLAHAEFLLARDPGDLKEKITRFLFPTDMPQFQLVQTEQRNKILNRQPPPPTEKIFGPEGGLFSYFLGPPEKPDDPKKWTLHHAAPFAAVRWTNIHDPHRLIFQGDVISGPVAPIFGAGIRDIDLRELRGQSYVFSHTLYWALPTGRGRMAHIEALRKAIDLQDTPDSQLWPV